MYDYIYMHVHMQSVRMYPHLNVSRSGGKQDL